MTALIKAGADPQAIEDMNIFGDDYDMSDAQAAWQHTNENSDEDSDEPVREKYSIQTLVDALGGRLGPKAIKRLLW